MNNKGFKLLLLPLLTVFIQSCSTLEDFKKMTPQSRAQKACNADPTVQHYTNLVSNSNHQLNKISTLLNNGYKTVKSCTTTTTQVPIIHKNTQTLHYESVLQETCSDHIVLLTDFATNRLLDQQNQLLSKLPAAKISMDESFQSCFEKVVDFSPERAIKYYEN